MTIWKEQLQSVLANSAQMQTVAYTALAEQMGPLGKYDVPDGTLPFSWAMEVGTQETALAIDEMKAGMRKLYTSMAITIDETYLHMSDVDYIGRFAVPSQTRFSLFLDYEEVIKKAVAYGTQGNRKITIPRLTEFVVNDMRFTMQYPLEIRVLRHGGIQCEYDATVSSPIETLETNIADWSLAILDRDDRRVIELSIPIKQFGIDTHTDPLNPSQLFKTSYTFGDQFYLARAYIQDTTTITGWREIKVTHTDQVYNPLDLTLVVQVNGRKLDVFLPTVYNTQGLVDGTIRVDIYTTRGYLEVDMGTYRPDQFRVIFNGIDDNPLYVAPLDTMSINNALSNKRITGGANGMSFEDLRNQVINNTIGPNVIPITGVQASAELERRGYTLVSNVDTITKRQFLASRRLPKPEELDLISGAGTVMSVLQVNMESLAKSKYTKDNGDRLTILPDMLYKYSKGKVTVLPDGIIDGLKALSAEATVRAVTDAQYVYTPFHYVLDASSNNFDCRPYYMDNPTIKRKYFVGENDTALLQVGVKQYDISKETYGYKLTVVLEESDQFKKLSDASIVLQASYLPRDEISWVATNSKYVGKTTADERVYEFEIRTDFDINSSNQVYTTNMSMYSTAQTRYGFDLETNVDISICVVNTQTPGYAANDMDQMVQAHLLPPIYMVPTRERLLTTFGYDMSKLWHRNRNLVGPESYQTWPDNVYAVYPEDQYLKDENGNDVIGYDGTNITYTKIHSRGDFVLDDKGNKVIQFIKGDVKLDAQQRPILVEPRKLMREITLFMVDGLFYFANEAACVKYKKEIPMEIVQWLETDLTFASRKLLDGAKLYLFPTTTYGETMATVKDGIDATVTIDQALSLTYYLTHSAFSNTTLRPALISNAKTVINDLYGRKTLAISDLITALVESSGVDVVGVEAFGLGGKNNFPVMTIDDDSVRLAMRKKLVVLANQELTVEDDLTINFKRHRDPVPIE